MGQSAGGWVGSQTPPPHTPAPADGRSGPDWVAVDVFVTGDKTGQKRAGMRERTHIEVDGQANMHQRTGALLSGHKSAGRKLRHTHTQHQSD